MSWRSPWWRPWTTPSWWSTPPGCGTPSDRWSPIFPPSPSRPTGSPGPSPRSSPRRPEWRSSPGAGWWRRCAAPRTVTSSPPWVPPPPPGTPLSPNSARWPIPTPASGSWAGVWWRGCAITEERPPTGTPSSPPSSPSAARTSSWAATTRTHRPRTPTPRRVSRRWTDCRRRRTTP